MIIDNFSLLDDSKWSHVFTQMDVPIFQNKVYITEKEALEAEVGNVHLVQSLQSGFIFNKSFNPKIMNYDENYQNEQSSSSVFKEHLNLVLELLKEQFGIQNKKVVEIGSGKGIFFEIMLKDGIDCIGFDPTYEGNNPKIVREYFSEEYNDINADVIIMRHTLEHIPNPFSFIHLIAKANNYKGKLFVEVPTFDWIYEKKAFWDIFYEHCNYFTEHSLSVMFEKATTGNFFGGQYIYLCADLSELRNTIPMVNDNKRNNIDFNNQIEKYEKILNRNESIAIWGAGAKGSTFLNLLDPYKKKVSYVIDINPAKQNKFIAHTAHPICSPAILDSKPVENILVMNENYLAEIKSILGDTEISLTTL